MAAYSFVIIFLLELLLLTCDANYTCPPNRGSCDCKPVNDVIVFDCTGLSQDLEYTLTYNSTEEKLVMECRCKPSPNTNCSGIYKVDMFAEFQFTSVKAVHFMTCPLPNISYSEMFGKLQPTTLSVTSFNPVEVLEYRQMANLSGISRLTIRGGEIKMIEENVFNDLENLEDLDLSLNMLKSLPNGIFNQTKNLMWINLYGNHLYMLPKIYEPLKSLNDLDLSLNKFVMFPDDSFQFAPGLRTLSLNHNRIKNLTSDVFRNLTSLTDLFLNYNDLMELPENLFETNLNLRTIDLSLNEKLGTLPENLLSETTSLVSLDLRRNNLTTLPQSLLKNLHNLRFLGLSRNKLTAIPEGFFNNTWNLTELELGVNKLTTLPINLLKPLQNLGVVILHNNQLTSIGQDLFSHLPALAAIDLSYNLIETIDKDAFEGSTHIAWLDLSNNLIQLDQEGFPLPSAMQHLNLTHNQIRHLPQQWTQAEFLHAINLTQNMIEAINIDQINFKSRETVLDLTYNHLMTINLNGINNVNTYVTNLTTESVPTILVNDNPMNCDCNLLEFVHFLKTRNTGERNPPFIFVADDLRCARPIKTLTTSQVLSTINEDNLYCSLDDVCSPSCTCRKTPITGITEMLCQDKGLYQMTKQKPYNTSRLYFDNNFLTDISFIQDPIWDRLSEAHFSRNNIRHIDMTFSLPRNLKLLTLDGNLLTSLPHWFMQEMDKRDNLTVTLGNNSWACDCTTLYFRHWLTNLKPGKINDISNVKCGPGKFNQKLLRDLYSKEMCPNDGTGASSAIVVTVLTILILLSAFMVAVYYVRRNSFHIKMWLFRHRMCLCLRTEDDAESGHPL